LIGLEHKDGQIYQKLPKGLSLVLCAMEQVGENKGFENYF
jgi:hypothetical protein